MKIRVRPASTGGSGRKPGGTVASGASPQRVAAGDGFEDAEGGGADGDDPFPGGLGGVDGGGGGRGEREAFLVHAVILESVCLHRHERPDAHVEGEAMDRDACFREGIDGRRVEVKPGGGSGDGPRRRRVDGLVPVAIRGRGSPGGSVDVGGQWHFAVRFGDGQHVGAGFETQEHVAFLVLGEDLGVQGKGLAPGIEELEAGSGPDPLARTQQHPPFARSRFLEEQDLEEPPGVRLESPQPRRDHPRIVDHDDIARFEMGEEIGKTAVLATAIGTMQDQQAGGVATGGRLLGDPFGREMEIECGDQHDTGQLTPKPVEGEREPAKKKLKSRGFRRGARTAMPSVSSSTRSPAVG